MPSQIPHDVQNALDAYVAFVHEAAPELLVGCYLHGSLALGAFNPGLSDIDFIAITSRACSLSDIRILQTVHEKLARCYPQMPFEGCYLQRHDVGLPDDALPSHPHVHDGVVQTNGNHDMNGIMWWILKHYGITVFGAPIDLGVLSVDWNDLTAKMHLNLNTYWASFLTYPRRIAWLLTDYGVQWVVLGVLRQLYTFREHAVISKVDAGLYALEHIPARWHRLIHEAINIRKGSSTSYRLRFARAIEARAFLQLIIAACSTGIEGHR